ncbi:MAG: hypothetical protein C5B49_01155 [Bdellovibrio sp.]|nr:MAG: hypothetical protein C5B49_01155 [Bdellovibrio sp.]
MKVLFLIFQFIVSISLSTFSATYSVASVVQCKNVSAVSARSSVENPINPLFLKFGVVTTDGDRQILELRKMNRKIERDRPDVSEMIRVGYFSLKETPVYQYKKGVPDLEQPLPLKVIELPFAKTGMYVPKELEIKSHGGIGPYDGYIIILPGIGTNISNATTLFNLGLTLENGKNPALKVEGRDRRVRLLPVMLDATLNGLGENSPFEFGKPEAAVEVVRNAHNILKLLFPNAPAFIAGRSHGGLIALEFGRRYQDISGLIAVNPTVSDARLHPILVQTSENNAQAVVTGTPIILNRSWRAYSLYGSEFLSLGADFIEKFFARLAFGRKKPIPTLILLGKNDPSYPQPDYVDFIKEAAAAVPLTEVEVYDVPAGSSHDLWSRREKRLFRDVVNRMASFVANITDAREISSGESLPSQE